MAGVSGQRKGNKESRKHTVALRHCRELTVLAEGNEGRNTTKDFLHFLSIAGGSRTELETQHTRINMEQVFRYYSENVRLIIL
ncbi:MAG: four helix bundle protein [Synergistaceae bacterium]|nr:four helix bundle protein [Synergistaceae bacterium]